MKLYEKRMPTDDDDKTMSKPVLNKYSLFMIKLMKKKHSIPKQIVCTWISSWTSPFPLTIAESILLISDLIFYFFLTISHHSDIRCVCRLLRFAYMYYIMSARRRNFVYVCIFMLLRWLKHLKSIATEM